MARLGIRQFATFSLDFCVSRGMHVVKNLVGNGRKGSCTTDVELSAL
jgi:hypothetical protein